MKRLLILIALFCVVFSCKKKKLVVGGMPSRTEQVSVVNDQKKSVVEKPRGKQSKQKEEYSSYEKRLIKKGFQDVEQIAGVRIDLTYTTKDNFVGQVLYDSLRHAFLRPFAYEKLAVAQTILQKEHPNYTVIVFDALRPNAVQHKMWEIVGGTPKEKYVASPSRGSIHNFGLAIDCSIYDTETSQLLDMGTAFDHLGIEAEYRHNAALVKQGKITEQAKENRELLRRIMTTAGFQPINSEWWHFNALSKQETRAKFEME